MFYAIQLLGVAVFAASGALSAGRKRMDLLGVMVLAIVTAVGGGTIRDVLLERYPVFWIADTAYLWVSIAAALVTLMYTRVRRPPENALAIADALGLALFTIVGAQIAEARQLTGVVVVLMGTITGVAGGVIRDVLSAEIPMILRRGQLYASAAIAGTAAYLLLELGRVPQPVAAAAGTAVIVTLRTWAIVRDVKLPVFTVGPVDPD